ncbi:ferredoxin [Virgisporangium aliadipatigenens]|uniref:Ferredoxin n=1 Tax=Virgisporangium aliadipatigenens TaxID=741659 RepID=A0A8J3YVY0_9ACTN|nr:ferredoxin [Virgisporangium aliadipatigenens]GIJ50693.1 ferredoxin [Virgisporangium aliadipatigenens]
MKIQLDQEKCVVSGQCLLAAPEVFDQRDEDGIAFLLTESPGADTVAEVRHAAAVCPVLAITLED